MPAEQRSAQLGGDLDHRKGEVLPIPVDLHLLHRQASGAQSQHTRPQVTHLPTHQPSGTNPPTRPFTFPSARPPARPPA